MGKPSLTAIVYDKRGRILSIGRNSYVKTHPLQAKAAAAVGESSKIYLHAEVAALVKVKDWSDIYKIVITRFNSKGEPVCAKPCRVCQYVLAQAGVHQIEHS